jgi:hypothetical protein
MNTLTDYVDDPPNQKRVRKWYYVDGETGVSFGDNTQGVYTRVGGPFFSMKTAKIELATWRKCRSNLFCARIVRVDEVKTVVLVKKGTT